jgi:hypothetical protein
MSWRCALVKNGSLGQAIGRFGPALDPKHPSATFVTIEGQVTIRGGHTINNFEAAGIGSYGLLNPEVGNRPDYKGSCHHRARQDGCLLSVHRSAKQFALTPGRNLRDKT